MSLILDSGAMVAFERGDRGVAAFIEAARRKGIRVATSSGCVAQCWRSGGARQARLALLLRGVAEEPIDAIISRAIGGLCARAGTDDIVDAHLALIARDADTVLTADGADLRALMSAERSRAAVHDV